MDSLPRRIILERWAVSNPNVASEINLGERMGQDQMLRTMAEDPANPRGQCSNIICQRQAQQITRLRQVLEQTMRELHLLRRQNRLLRSRLTKKVLAKTKRLTLKESDENGKTFTSATTGPPSYPEHVPQLNALLEEYQKHQEGLDPSTNLKNNVQSQVCQIKRFLGFMAAGESCLTTLEFLDNPLRVREWVGSLSHQKVVASKLGHYLKNVAQFIAYVKETSPSSNPLKQASLANIDREIRGIIKKQRRSVVLHQTMEGKISKTIPKAVLLKCRDQAKEEIPRILSRLTQYRSIKAQWSFYGHLMAYLSCIFGHQSEVFQNLTVDEVLLAKHDPETDFFLVNVEVNNLDQGFRVSQLLLTAEEYRWFEDFLMIKPRLPGGRTSQHFFFNSTLNPCRNLNKFLGVAWTLMDLPGKPKFADIRNAITTYARNALSPEDYGKVVWFMCYNSTSSNKVFALNPNPNEVAELRGLFESFVQAEEKREEKKDKAGGKTSCKNKRKQKTPEKCLAKKQKHSEEQPSTSADGAELRYQKCWDFFREDQTEDRHSQQLKQEGQPASMICIPDSQKKPNIVSSKPGLLSPLKEMEGAKFGRASCKPEMNPAEILEFVFNGEEQRVKEEELEDDPLEILEFVFDGEERHVKEDVEDEQALHCSTEDQHTLQGDGNTRIQRYWDPNPSETLSHMDRDQHTLQTGLKVTMEKEEEFNKTLQLSGYTKVKEEEDEGLEDDGLAENNPESFHTGITFALKDEIKKEKEDQHLRSPEAAKAPSDGAERRFSCSQCGKSFRTCSSLKLHQKCHSDKRPFSCTQCGRSFRARGHLKQHMFTHTGGIKRLYTCSRCGSRFDNVVDLKSHKKIHTGEKPYCCSECGKRLTTRESLLYHMRIHTGEKPYQCDMCGKAFRSAPVLKEHKRIHTGEKPFQCPQCGRSFSKKRHLSSHVQTHTGEKPYQCFQCGKSFSRATSLKIHQITHTGEKPFICTECGMRFTTRGSLGYHMRIHTGDKPHECLQCGKSYARPGHLRIHMMSHTGEKPFACPQCGKSFLYHGSFQAHMTIHTGEKPFACTQCGKKSSTLRLHKSHMTVHDADKPFTCSQCGKSFSHPSGFKAHLRVHSGEKPFMCDQCGKSFSHLSSLTVHMRIHTGEQPFTCNRCGKHFAKSGPFKLHQREHCESQPAAHLS